MLNIEEIKARAKRKLTGKNKFHGYIATKSSKHGEGVYDEIINRLYQCEYEDIPALIAEVERLKAKLKGLTGIEASEHQRIALLKKALQLMAKDFYNASKDKTHFGPGWLETDYIARAAQQLTHETNGESEGEK